jgi:hypothetical protein
MAARNCTIRVGVAGTRAKRKPYVFIAHASADREWVRGYLIPAVGLPRAQVMTSDEFRPGAPIVEELSAAVGSSRYTTCSRWPR